MNLMSRLPSYYLESNEVINIQNSIEKEGNLAQEAVEDLFLQLFIDSATWGLDFWEILYGIKVNVSKDYGLRRSKIKSKMRGTGTTTVELIKNISESFVNGEVEVIEHNEEYYFEVKMVSVKGIPPNMQDLKDAIEEAKPAHLGVIYVILYNTHEDLKRLNHGQMAAYSHIDLRQKGDLY